MTFKEIPGNLFDAPETDYLVHCIASDYALGAGIAKEFVKRFDMRNKLKEMYPAYGDEYVCQALLVDRVFNLVTKVHSKDKPTYYTLWSALCSLKAQVMSRGIKSLSMPRIGCGLDKLDWATVRQGIMNIFGDTDVSITIYYI